MLQFGAKLCNLFGGCLLAGKRLASVCQIQSGNGAGIVLHLCQLQRLFRAAQAVLLREPFLFGHRQLPVGAQHIGHQRLRGRLPILPCGFCLPVCGALFGGESAPKVKLPAHTQ